MLLGVEVHAQDTAGHIDLAVEEAKGRNGELVWVFGLAGVPLRRIPGEVYPV